MNPLEQHLFHVIFGYPFRYEEDNKLQNAIEDKRRATAKEAAAVALKWIEKALSDAFNQANYSQLHPDVVKRMEYNEWALNWLKEKGLKTPEA